MESQRLNGWRQDGWRVVSVLCFLLCILLSSPLRAESVVTITDSFDRISLGEYLDVLEDKDRVLTLTEVQSPKISSLFESNNSTTLKRTLSGSAWWVRFNVQNPGVAPRDLLLDLDRANLGRVSFFTPSPSGAYIQRDAGIKTTRIIGDEVSNTFRFRVHLSPGQISTYFLRIESDRGLITGILLGTPESMALHQKLSTTLLSFGLGALTCLFLYSFILLHTHKRDRSRIWFTLYLMAVIGYLLTSNGIIGIEFLRIRNLQTFLEICTIFLVEISATLFAGSFLHSHLSAALRRFLNIQALVLGILFIIAVTLAPSNVSYILVATSLWISITLPVVGFFAWRNDLPIALLFIAARLVMTLTMFLAMINLPTVVAVTLPMGSLIMIAFCIEALLLAIGLSLQQRQHLHESALLQHQQQIDEAKASAKSDFLAQMSHEIRTPMSGILGMTELLADTPLTAGQRDYVSTIHASSNALLRILNDILDHSQIESGKIKVVQDPFDLNILLNESLSLLKAHAEEKHLELIATIAPDLPALILGDPTRLRQVISNLLRNAIKFTQHGQVEVHLQKGKLGLRVEVRDSGIGIAPDKIAALFQPGTSKGTPGAGLSLSICKELVELMGGEIGVNSQLRQGSTFWFELPLMQQTASQPEDPVLDQWLRGMRLLVVDDNQTVNRVVEEQAGRWGMTVRMADNGAEGLALARNAANIGEPFDIILLDHNMPGMSGLQLAARIKEDPIIRNDVIMMMLTGMSVAPTNTMARNVGIRRILAKPVTERQLKTAIAEELGYLKTLQEQTAKLGSPDLERLKELRVLIAEDNHLSQKVIRGMLAKLGVTPTVVANGREAVEEVTRHEYDVVLMDCDMPFMDGYSATQTIREWEKLTGRKPIPILALTAHILDEHKKKSREAGMNAHLSKPVELAELQNALLTWSPRQHKIIP